MQAHASFQFGQSPESLRQPRIEQLLCEAEQLIFLGFPRAATMTGRVALEMALAARCQEFDCWPTGKEGVPMKHPSLENMTGRLLSKERIGERLHSRLHRAAKIGNNAAHAAKVTRAGMFFLLAVVNELADSLRLPPPAAS